MSSRRMMMAYILTHQSRLPAEFQEVEWIGSSGTQYIDTGVKANISNFEIELYGKINQRGSGSHFMFGSWVNSSTDIGINAYDTGDTIYLYYGNSHTNRSGYPLTTLARYTQTATNFKINGTTEITYSSNIGTSGYIYLFCANSSGSPAFYSQMQCNGLTITSGGTLIRNFVPCYRKLDGVIGLYDLVNGVFYTNAGTGTFTAGQEAN